MHGGERVGAGVGRELVRVVGGGETDHGHPGRPRRLDAGGGVLDHEAVGRHHAQPARGEEIDVGHRLPAGHVLGADQHRRHGEPGVLEPRRGTRAWAGGRDRPGAFGHRAQQPHGAGHRGDRLGTGIFGGEERLHFGFGIELRRGDTDRLHGAAAVTHPQERLRTEAAGAGPPAPLLLDVRGGVHQDAVEIEEDGGALEAFHVRQ
jgi:hypothetical protein